MHQSIYLQLIYRVTILLFLSTIVIGCNTQLLVNTSEVQTTVSTQEKSTTPTTRSAAALTTVTFPTQHPLPQPQAYPAAQLSGQLLLVNNCVRIGTPESSHLIIWPTGFGYQFENDQLSIIDATGAKRATESENVQLGGGEISSDPTAWQNTLGLQQLPPANCSGPYWYADPSIEVVK